MDMNKRLVANPFAWVLGTAFRRVGGIAQPLGINLCNFFLIGGHAFETEIE
jgi:hypothetical protein